MPHLARLAPLLALIMPRMAPPAIAASDHDYMTLPRQQIEVRSPVEAMIESVRVRRGDVVTRGQVVATLESGPERAALAVAQSRASMQGEIRVAEARLDLAEKKLQLATEELRHTRRRSTTRRVRSEARG